MPTEKTKDNGVKVEGKIFECCNPQNFHRMFGKMGEYFQGQEDVGNFSAMKSNMMKYMMEMCCSSKTAGTKADFFMGATFFFKPNDLISNLLLSISA